MGTATVSEDYIEFSYAPPAYRKCSLAIGDRYCTDEVPFGNYVAGQKPYDGSETFETSGCTSRPRFEKYNELRKENKKFQVSAASYGWLLTSVKMSWYIKYCGWKKLSAPVLLFQAEKDDFVSVNALRKLAEKINHRGITSCEYVYLPGTRHETYRSDDRTMEMYLDKIMKFLD